MSNKNNDNKSENKTEAEAKKDENKAGANKSAPQNNNQKNSNASVPSTKAAAAKNTNAKTSAAKPAAKAATKADDKKTDAKPAAKAADAKKEAPKADVKKEEAKKADSKPAQAAAAVPAKPAKSGAGFGSLLVAALLGGVASIALLGAGGYYMVQSNNLGALSAVMNTSTEAANSDETRYTELSTRVVALEGDVAELRDQAANAAPAENDENASVAAAASNADQVNALEAQVKSLADAQTALADNVKAIETGLGGGSDAPVSLDNVDAKMVAGLNVEIEKLKNMVAALEANQAKAPSQQAETPATDEPAENNDGGEVVTTTETTDLSEVNAQIAAQKADIEAQAAKIAELASQITSVNENVATNAAAIEKVAESGGKIGSEEANQMAQAVALASLERALQDEKPFSEELNSVKSFAKDDATIASLENFAATGIKNDSSLIASFDGLIDKAITADLKGEASSVLDKFIGNAKSMISIRRTGNVKGNDAEAVIARMEVALKANDLETAVNEAANMSGPAAEVFAPWVAEAKANVEAKTLMRQLSANILKSLAAN